MRQHKMYPDWDISAVFKEPAIDQLKDFDTLFSYAHSVEMSKNQVI